MVLTSVAVKGNSLEKRQGLLLGQETNVTKRALVACPFWYAVGLGDALLGAAERERL